MTAALMVVAMALCFTAGAVISYFHSKDVIGAIIAVLIVIVVPFIAGTLFVEIIRFLFELFDK